MKPKGQHPHIKTKLGEHIGSSRADLARMEREGRAPLQEAQTPDAGFSEPWMHSWRIVPLDSDGYIVASPRWSFKHPYPSSGKAEDVLAVSIAREVIVPVKDLEDGCYYPCLKRNGGRRLSDEAWHDIDAFKTSMTDPKRCKELLLRAVEVSGEARGRGEGEARRRSRGPNFPRGWKAVKQSGGWRLLRHGKPCGPARFASCRQALDWAREAFVREHFCIDSLDRGKSAAIVWKTSGPFGSKAAWEGFADGLAAEACLHRRVKGFLALIAHGFWPDRDVRRIPLQDARRTGPPRREGSARPASFLTAFGFHGVEFGLWNNQAERQRLLDMAWDGLMDLADILGVSPRALSLGGQLSLAFGARGNGTGPAHYEWKRTVINLTKPRGAGCLAHEWFHAFDHYLARTAGFAANVRVPLGDGGTGYANSPSWKSFYSHASGPGSAGSLPGGFIASWERLKTSIHRGGNLRSPFISSAWRLDGKRATCEGRFWSNASELLARAFEAFVEDEIERRGQVSEFLVNGTHETLCGVPPYPQDAQRDDIDKAMRSLMQCVAEMLELDAPMETAGQDAGEDEGIPEDFPEESSRQGPLPSFAGKAFPAAGKSLFNPMRMS